MGMKQLKKKSPIIMATPVVTRNAALIAAAQIYASANPADYGFQEALRRHSAGTSTDEPFLKGLTAFTSLKRGSDALLTNWLKKTFAQGTNVYSRNSQLIAREASSAISVSITNDQLKGAMLV